MPPVGGGSAGRATNGNIVLTEIEVEVQPKTGGDAWIAAPIRWIETEHSQTSWPVAAAIDGDPKTGWALLPRQAEHHEAICVLESPVRIAGGARVRVRMKHESIHGQHGVSRFRISCSGGSGYPALDVGPWHRSKVFPAASAREALDAQPIDPAALELAALDEAGVPIWTEVGFTDGVIQQYEQIIGSIYLTRVIEAPAAGSIDISLGSDDSIYLWLNAEQVLAREIARSVAVDQELETLELKPGRNVILMKIVNQGGGFASYYQGEDGAMEAESALLVRTLTQVSASRSEEERASLREHYRRTASPQWRETSERREEVATARDALVASYAQTMIMQERPEPRPTHMLIRGQYDQKGEQLEAAVPSVFPPLPADAEADRLGLARWLVDPRHPLTARVTVNRLWQQLFGTGIVKTSEDFGSQGEWPSHPELLDWLAVEFIESGWDIQHMQRLMLTSAAYAQVALVSSEKQAEDPENRLLSRGVSHRLDAEAIRDGALYLSGLLVEEVGGPSVKPYQPSGIWFAVGYSGSNTVRFAQDVGEKLYRRSLYTFWKRTAPPPSLSTFDAPSREEVCVRRERTNTPLQALVLLNDVQYVEAARVWAERLLSTDTSDSERLGTAFRMATSREPAAVEIEILVELLNAQRMAFAADATAAAALIAVGESMTDRTLQPAELAAWTAVTSVILNLHETITRG
jgi:hypothetical protein